MHVHIDESGKNGEPRGVDRFRLCIRYILGDLDDLVEAGMKVTRLLNNNMKTVTKEDARRIYSQILC